MWSRPPVGMPARRIGRTARAWDIVPMSTSVPQPTSQPGSSQSPATHRFSLPVVREIPKPPAQAGSAW